LFPGLFWILFSCIDILFYCSLVWIPSSKIIISHLIYLPLSNYIIILMRMPVFPGLFSNQSQKSIPIMKSSLITFLSQ
jgi:hypothetical protein